MSLTPSYPRMLRRVLALLAAVFLISWGLAITSQANASDSGQVCSGLDSGKIDTTGDPGSVTVSAPDGQLITGYCVKAGSTKNGGGPVYKTVAPTESLTLTYPGGKAISHYSLSYTTDGGGEDCTGTDYNGSEAGCGEPDEGDNDCPAGMEDHNGTEAGCGTPPEQGAGQCEGGPMDGATIPDDQTEEEFCSEGTGGPGGPGGPGTPGGNNPGGDNPGGNNPAGNSGGGPTVLGVQASSGAGAPSSSAGSSAGAGAGAAGASVPTAVDAGFGGSAPVSAGSPLAAMLIAFGFLVAGLTIMPFGRSVPRHRKN